MTCCTKGSSLGRSADRMGEGTGPRLDPVGRICGGSSRDPRKGREQNELNMRRSVDAAFRSIAGTENAICADAHILKFRRAACCEPLAEAIPVVVDRNARLIGIDKHGNSLAVLVGCHDQMVGVKGAGRIVLCAVEPQPIGARLDRCPIAINGTDAQFGDGDADKRALRNRLEPARFDELILVEEQVLDDVEMDTQRLRKIGVGSRRAR